MDSSRFFRVKPIARLIFKAQNFSRSRTISYQSLLLSTTVLNDIATNVYTHVTDIIVGLTYLLLMSCDIVGTLYKH